MLYSLQATWPTTTKAQPGADAELLRRLNELQASHGLADGLPDFWAVGQEAAPGPRLTVLVSCVLPNTVWTGAERVTALALAAVEATADWAGGQVVRLRQRRGDEQTEVLAGLRAHCLRERSQEIDRARKALLRAWKLINASAANGRPADTHFRHSTWPDLSVAQEP